jgi:hypothetical protein
VLLALRRRAELGDHLGDHVADRHRHRRARAGAGQLDHRQRVGHGPGLDPAERLGHVDAEQPELRRLAQALAREAAALVELGGARRQDPGGELPCRVDDHLLAVVEGQVEHG